MILIPKIMFWETSLLLITNIKSRLDNLKPARPHKKLGKIFYLAFILQTNKNYSDIPFYMVASLKSAMYRREVCISALLTINEKI